MLYITYQNENGKLDFNGGSGHFPWRILEIDGLGLSGKSFHTAAYPSSVGQKTLSETVGARTISIQCDVNSIASSYGAARSNQWEISKALKILNEPGTLLIRDGRRTRKIDARCVEAAQGERYGGYTVFAMQFVCDYPYFEDQQMQTIPIFKCENLIGNGTRWYLDNGVMKSEPIEKKSFKLPCLFSRRITETNIINVGDVNTEPIIRIHMQGGTYTGIDGETGTLVIHNRSTKQDILLNLQEAENVTEIIIDIPKRIIVSQDKQNLIHYLAPTSFLSDFWLQTGQNLIKVENYLSNSCSVECEFSNKYVEAVIG